MKLRTEKDVIITEDLTDLNDQGMKSIFLAQRESKARVTCTFAKCSSIPIWYKYVSANFIGTPTGDWISAMQMFWLLGESCFRVGLRSSLASLLCTVLVSWRSEESGPSFVRVVGAFVLDSEFLEFWCWARDDVSGACHSDSRQQCGCVQLV